MALGSGLGSQFGFAKEASAWGTRAAPDHWLPVTKWDIQKVAERVTGQGISAGSFTEQIATTAEASQMCEATVECEVFNKQMGLLLVGFMGSVSGPTQLGGTAAYSQTHTLAAINPGDLRSLTLQGGIPKRSGGTAICKEAQGMRIKSAEFSCEAGGLLEAKFELVGKKFDGSQALGTASYTSGLIPFAFKDGSVKAGTYGAEATLPGVRKMSVKYEVPLDEPWTFGGAGYYAYEQVQNGFTQITGSLSVDYDTTAKSLVEDLALSSTISSAYTSLVWDFTGPTAIAGSYYPEIKFTLPGTLFEARSAAPDGVKEVTVDYDFKCYYDGTNQPSIYYVSTDTAL